MKRFSEMTNPEDSEENPLSVLSQAATFVDHRLKQGKAEDLSMGSQRSSDHYEEYPLKLKFKSRSFRGFKSKRDEVLDQSRYKMISDGIVQQRYENLAWHHTLTHRNHGNALDVGSNDAPLDMSIKPQCDPVQSRPSVITCTPSVASPSSTSDRRNEYENRDESGMCDPVIDEHFRRSLGKDYHFYLKNKVPSNAESSQNVSITVDDHFAKALGDTWLNLQKSQSSEDSQNSNSTPSNIFHHGLVS